MITATEALVRSTPIPTLAEMMELADERVNRAVSEKIESCVVLFSKNRYERVDIRNFINAVSDGGYCVTCDFYNPSDNWIVELKW
ncbi:hypothetical protein CDG60_12275 [Acinetobacter chinensis]|uniref:Uncharacterized protein n=1 Tax=Acinetobacter chinensis TaxID=2004650 RepID=A0A3B7M3R7_9GAMM|nr:hypothetical protein [Acinetobacter chinensis]AXY57273.1 hypothetical protein CDG60_12275 [Acinetobacter chinensis]